MNEWIQVARVTLLLIASWNHLAPGTWVILGKGAYIFERQKSAQGIFLHHLSNSMIGDKRHLRLRKRTSKQNIGAEILFKNREGKIKLFALSKSLVFTRISKQYTEARYQGKRSELAKILPVIPCEIDSKARTMREPYVSGKVLAELNDDQVRIFFKLIENKVLNEMYSDKFSHFCDLCEEVVKLYSKLIETFQVSKNRSEEFNFLSELLMKTSITLGDLSESNVIFDEYNFHVIDVDERRLACRPIWFDYLYLYHRLQKIGKAESIDIIPDVFRGKNSHVGVGARTIVVEFMNWLVKQEEVKYPTTR